MEENAESKEIQIKKLEATVKSLSEELIKVGGAAQTSLLVCNLLAEKEGQLSDGGPRSLVLSTIRPVKAEYVSSFCPNLPGKRHHQKAAGRSSWSGWKDQG